MYVGIATLAATEIGTITYMYMAELGYKAGFAAFAAALISGCSMILVGRTGFIIGRFRDLKLMTVPEYFEVKYSRGLRIVTGFVVALGGILNMGVFLKIEGQFLMTVSGIDSRYLVAVMTGILLLELVYTVLGGMVSVVITDFMQYILLSIATIIVLDLCGHHDGIREHRRQGCGGDGSRWFQPPRAPASAGRSSSGRSCSGCRSAPVGRRRPCACSPRTARPPRKRS